jgi:hypothetical protein
MDEDDAARQARNLVIALYEGSAKARAQIEAVCAKVGLDWDTLHENEAYCRDLVIQRSLQLGERGCERAAAESRADLDAERETISRGPLPGPPRDDKNAHGQRPEPGRGCAGTLAPGSDPADEGPCTASGATGAEDGDSNVARPDPGAERDAEACARKPSPPGSSGSRGKDRKRRRGRRKKGRRPPLLADALQGRAPSLDDAEGRLAREPMAGQATWTSGPTAVDASVNREGEALPLSAPTSAPGALSLLDPSGPSITSAVRPGEGLPSNRPDPPGPHG